VILISLDTCRADRLSCYGAERENTPALDRLASESVLFTDCIAQSSLTAPSHMSLFTGQTVQRHGILTNRWGVTPPVTLATTLRDAGWRTAAFTGNGSLQAVHGVDTGFDTFESKDPSEEGELEWPFTRNVADVTPHALRWLATAGGAPAFLFVHGYDPHCPYAPPEPWRTEYGGWYEGGRSFDSVCGPVAFKREIKDGALGVDEKRWLNDLYDAELRAADQALGEFLDALRESGVFDRSIVVFLSDHGEILGRSGWVGHGMLWEEALHVPLMIRFPDGEHAGVFDEQVQLIDVLPTLLDGLGLQIPDGVQGMSLMGVIRGGGAPFPTNRMRISRVGPQVSVRFGTRWKIIFEQRLDDTDGRPSVPPKVAVQGLREIFDLEADPHEEKNLFATEDGKARFNALASDYAYWRLDASYRDEQYRGTAWRTVDTPEDERMLKALGYTGDDDEDEGGD
jgi:arylsulfatase